MKSQATKAAEFAALHEQGCFVIPNPWDVGSARILAGLGFAALTTTSAGFARANGVPDYNVTRDMVMSHARALTQATDLPIAADLEDGFGPNPDDCAETIRRAAASGLVGGSIEDWTGNEADPIHEIARAADRIRAAAEAARALPFKFMLVGRCENHLHGRTDLADTIKRLQAYQEAGADVLFAPGLTTAEQIGAVVSSLDRPVNVIGGIGGVTNDLPALAALGVRRVSIGNFLHSAAMTGMITAAMAMQDGRFDFTATLVPGAELNRLLKAGSAG
jgi:2-methylisocitrate lyase-like PEP mutase family enzyme